MEACDHERANRSFSVGARLPRVQDLTGIIDGWSGPLQRMCKLGRVATCR